MVPGPVHSKLNVLICIIILTLCSLSSARASSTLTFFPIEDSKYILRGAGWQPGEIIHLTVDYDSVGLAAPEATVMGGELLALSQLAAVPGHTQITVHNSESSPGFELCVFFQKQGDYPSIINFVTAEQEDPKGIRRVLQVEMLENPNLPQADEDHQGGR